MIDCNVSAVTLVESIRFSTAETYWSILKPLLMVKIPLIPPLISLLEKVNIFNDFFSQQRQALSNDSISLSMPIYCTNNRSNISFSYGKILKVIQSVDANEVNDDVSGRILKLSCLSIVKPFLVYIAYA